MRILSHPAISLSIAASVLFAACSHDLAVRNASVYETPVQISNGNASDKPSIGVAPFQGDPDSLFYFNTLVSRLASSGDAAAVRTDYVASSDASADAPDLLLEVQPTVNYRSSGWNFLINWPGFLIFTPAWNGYVYRADILTRVRISDGTGRPLKEIDVPITYNLRHADFNRTLFTGLAWFEVTSLALFGGIYNANVFDRDAIAPLQQQVQDNYGNYVLKEIRPQLASALASVRTPVQASEPALSESELSEPQLPAVSSPPNAEEPSDTGTE